MSLTKTIYALRAIEPILSNWEFLDENMLLWATDDRIALIEKWAEFAYLIEDGLSQFPEHNFDNENETNPTTVTPTMPTVTEPTEQTQPSTEPAATLPVIDKTLSGTTGSCTWELRTLTGVLTISGNGSMASYSSASSYPWYEYRGYVKQLIIKNGVKSIGSYAFNGCNNLTGTIEISKSVQRIEDCAFRGTKPSKIITPFIGYTRTSTSNRGILGYWFGSSTADCNVEQTYIYKEQSGYSDKSHHNCAIPSSIKEIIVTDTKLVSSGAFSGCSFIQKITLNNEVTNIESYAFQKCSGLTEIIIPESVTNIGEYAFYYANGLTKINLPSNLESIKSYVFSGCSKIAGTIEIPETVTSIGSYAFYGCNNITGKIKIPGAVTSIGLYAFSGCSKIENVTVCDGVKSIGSYAFNGCNNLTGTIEIAKSVQSIGSCAFRETKPSKIIVPFIGYSRTSNSSDGILGYWFGSSTADCNVEQTYIYKNQSGYSDKSHHNYAIPDSIKEIIVTDTKLVSSGAFSGCSFIQKITLNNEVTNIESYAFQKCSGLTEIIIPESVTNIGEYAFSGCYNLKNIYYQNTSTHWDNINIGANNSPLSTSKIHFSNHIGDVNLDGVVNIKDATLIQMYLAEFVQLNDEQKAVADTDSDGFISITDATQIQKYLVELIPSLG